MARRLRKRNDEERDPRITRIDAKKLHSDKRKSFALIRVIRGQIRLFSLVFIRVHSWL